jgi:hypothetical protein
LGWIGFIYEFPSSGNRNPRVPPGFYGLEIPNPRTATGPKFGIFLEQTLVFLRMRKIMEMYSKSFSG